ncbi:hypothetical protein HNP84_001555 [Thermocatellispora tengchongensis]|uniref:Uncharacterized protein n=1 Tax=Thermocatellispora tengchongensis TaxID=1073253 RepID=A0A840NXA6_9ACTN|nr:hypothetical protein [Thermocatellispora tengchongensis]MBB5131842.1 hypothetical protein [Thermocatellispora tengchongensis]
MRDAAGSRAGGPRRRAYIVGIAGTPEEFRLRLRDVSGVTYLRELPPRRVVIVTDSPREAEIVAAMPGVEWIREDRPEQRL